MEQAMPLENNRALLRGEMAQAPVFSHENHGRRFDRLELAVPRLSGVRDQIPVLAEHGLLAELSPGPGAWLEVEGQIRSYNNHSGQGRRLVISVYAFRVAAAEGPAENQVYLAGRLCRDPVYRRTPLGREIADVMLAVARNYGRSDYLPCILWGSLARMAAECQKGQGLWLWGRLQSRVYLKQLPEGGQERTAYEISAITAGRDELD